VVRSIQSKLKPLGYAAGTYYGFFLRRFSFLFFAHGLIGFDVVILASASDDLIGGHVFALCLAGLLLACDVMCLGAAILLAKRIGTLHLTVLYEPGLLTSSAELWAESADRMRQRIHSGVYEGLHSLLFLAAIVLGLVGGIGGALFAITLVIAMVAIIWETAALMTKSAMGHPQTPEG
jgi:tetrahydromethanopterin S-methyltransferase subunit D